MNNDWLSLIYVGVPVFLIGLLLWLATSKPSQSNQSFLKKQKQENQHQDSQKQK